MAEKDNKVSNPESSEAKSNSDKPDEVGKTALVKEENEPAKKPDKFARDDKPKKDEEYTMKFRELSKAQKKKLFFSFFTYVTIGVVILSFMCTAMLREKDKAKQNWDDYLADPPELAERVAEYSQDAIKIEVGTYVENVKEINIKNSFYRMQFYLWFNWEGDEIDDMSEAFRIYKGTINNKTLVKDVHEGNKHYQLLSMDVSVTKNFVTRRFPLDSHQLRMYVESTRPIHEVVFIPDHESSGINANFEINGYDYIRSDFAVVSYEYSTNHGDATIPPTEITSEFVSEFEINRASFGLYLRCFIALVGTITWVLIALFICTYHYVDPLGMVPAALFGTVSNIMIGASLLPDSLEMGLIEYVNFWGIMIILSVTITIIHINRIRNKQKDRRYAHYYGRIMFWTIVFFVIAGNVLLPISAYIFI